MAIAAPDYRFSYVDIGGYGRQADGGTWKASKMGRALELGELAIPPPQNPPGATAPLPHVFVADAAFPLKPNLMRPYPGQKKATTPKVERIYNYRHSRARRVVCST